MTRKMEFEAYALYEPLATFLARYWIYSGPQVERLKELIKEGFGPDDRATEAAVGQFLAQLDYLKAEEYKE